MRKWLIPLTVIVCIGAIIMPRTPITEEGFGNIPTLITIDVGSLQIVNSAAEEEFYRVTIPRNTLGVSNRMIHLELDYALVNTTGAAKTITWRAYYGLSAACVAPVATWQHVVAYGFSRFHVWLINTGDVETQFVYISDEANIYSGNTKAITEKSNEDLDLIVTVQFNAAAVNLEIDRLVAKTTQMAH